MKENAHKQKGKNMANAPGLTLIEQDQSSFVQTYSASQAGFAGDFSWGPVNYPTLVQNTANLATIFGVPSLLNNTTFYSAIGYLDYSDSLMISRSVGSGSKNSTNPNYRTIVAQIDNYETTSFANINYTFASEVLGDEVTALNNLITAQSIPVVASLIGTSPDFRIKFQNNSTSAIKLTLSGTILPYLNLTVSEFVIQPSSFITTGILSVPSGTVVYTGKTITVASAYATFVVGETFTTSDSKVATLVSISATELGYYNENFQLSSGTSIVGNTSGATATIESTQQSYLRFKLTNLVGLVVVGNTITGGTSGAVATIRDYNQNGDGYVIYELNPSSTNFVSGESVLASNGASFDISTSPALINYASFGIAIPNNDAFLQLASKPFVWAARYMGDMGDSIKVSVGTRDNFSIWEYKSLFDGAPDTNEIHIVIVDVDGVFYNHTPNSILDTYSYLSTVQGTTDLNGQNNYYKDVINNGSAYIYAGDNAIDRWNSTTRLNGGYVATPTSSDIITSYQAFNSPVANDIFYYFTGQYDATVDNAVIALAEANMKTVVFCSPTFASVSTGSQMDKTNAIVTWSQSITVSNRVFLDSNWRQILDTFNNVYVWVPCASATCGLSSRTDTNAHVWDSPMGYTRGVYANTSKLVWEPQKSDRDILYSSSINPIFTDGNNGIILLGDRTHQIKPSYLRQLAVRKTCIVVEQSALSLLKFYIGENNNTVTRGLARSQIRKFLQDIGSAGAFRRAAVVLDESNNTEQVINNQELRCLIKIQPQSSVNYIQLTLSVVNSESQFTEEIIPGTF